MSAPVTSLEKHSHAGEPRPRLLPRLALLLAVGVGLLVVRLESFGIWDPWELSIADTARRMLEGSAGTLEMPPLRPWLISRGFGWLATREWAGRMPIALSGLFSVALLWAWVRKIAGERVALYAGFVATTSLMLILNSRQMLGAAPSLCAGGLVALGSARALFPGRHVGPGYVHWAWAAAALVGVVLGILSQGALLAALPPLLAAVFAAGLTGGLSPRAPSRRRLPGWALTGLAAVMTLWIGYDVWADTAAYSPWVGGLPQGEQPPTYERTLEVVFHGFAPWSALLPLAVGACLRLDDDEGALRADAPLRLMALLWAAFAYASHSLFQSRFGSAAFPGTLALAAMVALWLRDVERARRSFWAAGLVAAFFVGLIIRDFALYPTSPIDALSVQDADVPSLFNPKRTWGVLLGGFSLAVVIAAAARPAEGRLDLRAPYRWLRAQWGAGVGMRVWLGLAALLALTFLTFGVVCWAAPRALHLTSLATRAGRAMLFVPLAVPVAVSGGQAAWFGVCKLERYRLWPTWIMALLVAAYAAHGFLPSLSGHFSPREVFDVYNRHAQTDEPLAEYQVGSRAAAYYAAGPIQELQSPRELVDYLVAERRRWATFPAEKLAEIDRDYRKRSDDHLFVASDPNARVVLVANQPVSGLRDQNPLASHVLDEAPPVEHPVEVNFDNKIELIGYDLKLPGGDYVGPGQKLEIQWVFRALSSHIGSYQVFVHIDGAGNRLNGDHEPVDDQYPVRLWEKGDVVVDRQTLAVPANYRAGRYEIFMGFFRGSSRLGVVSGPHDSTDRARVGHIVIR